MPTQFRLLTEQDAVAYQKLRLEALAVNPASFLSVSEVEATRSLLSFQYELQNAKYPPVYGYQGVFIDGQLAGYLQLGCSTLPKQAHIAFLYNVYIGQSYRRQGLGRQLLERIIALLKQQTPVERLFVTCNALNDDGARFYQAMGFTVCGHKPKSVKWQGQYDDEVEWVKEIKLSDL